MCALIMGFFHEVFRLLISMIRGESEKKREFENKTKLDDRNKGCIQCQESTIIPSISIDKICLYIFLHFIVMSAL